MTRPSGDQASGVVIQPGSLEAGYGDVDSKSEPRGTGGIDDPGQGPHRQQAERPGNPGRDLGRMLRFHSDCAHLHCLRIPQLRMERALRD